jgi:ammonium transporter, Amt family
MGPRWPIMGGALLPCMTGETRFVLLTWTAATLLWSAALGFVIVKVVHAVTGLRVGAETEEQGLDLRLHGERGYNM